MKDKPDLPTSGITFTFEKPKMGRQVGKPAGATKQLGKLQRRVLLWLYNQELAILETGDSKKVKELHHKGVPCTAKRFYDDPSPTASQQKSLSRAIRELEATSTKKRGLVIRYDVAGGTGAKPRTTHVKLTELGRSAASYEKRHGKTERQVLEGRKEETMQRELSWWRSQWKKTVTELQLNIGIFEREGGVLFAIGDPGHDGQGTLFQEQYEKEERHRIAEIEAEIRHLEMRLDLPHKPLVLRSRARPLQVNKEECHAEEECPSEEDLPF